MESANHIRLVAIIAHAIIKELVNDLTEEDIKTLHTLYDPIIEFEKELLLRYKPDSQHSVQ